MRCVISLVGALRLDSRLIFTFTLMTRPCPASGASQCGSNVRTAELNMRRRWAAWLEATLARTPSNETHKASGGRAPVCASKLTGAVMQCLACRVDNKMLLMDVLRHPAPGHHWPGCLGCSSR